MQVGMYKSALFGPQNTKKSLPKFSIGDRTILNKKVHANPKFKNVTPKTDTGFNSRKREELQKEISKYYKIQNNEVFSRISPSDFLQLMIADSHEVFLPKIPEEKETEEEEKAFPDIPRPLHEHKPTDLPAPSLPPFLLVDVRPPSEYQRGHLIGAVNHESSRLARSVNWESQDLIRYRNHPEWIIVVYDYAEDLAQEYASTLIHRGYENVYVLSGGLKLARDKFGFPFVIEKMDGQDTSDLVAMLHNKLNFDDGLPSYEDLFKVSNQSVPVCVTETLAEQLSSIILPPLSSKGSGADCWMRAMAGSETGCASQCSTARTSKHASMAASCSGATGFSSTQQKLKPWR